MRTLAVALLLLLSSGCAKTQQAAEENKPAPAPAGMWTRMASFIPSVIRIQCRFG